MSFAGKVFFAAFCTGTAADATNAKLVTVPDGATATPARLDGNAAPTLKPLFVADSTGSKLFVIRTTNSAGRIIAVGGAVGGVEFDTNVADGTMLPDGSGIVYRTTGGALKKATTASPPVVSTTIAANVKGLLSASRDNKSVLFHTLDRQASSPLIDASLVDHTAAAPAAISLIPTAAAVPVGFTGDSSQVLFIGDVTQTSAKLKSIPVAGSNAKVLTDTLGAVALDSGSGALSVSNPKQAGQAPFEFTIFDLAHVDAITGKVSSVADGVPEGEFGFKGKRVVYSRFAQQGSGLYAATLP